jgi:signal transduction histidine kinase/ActR/RegA family two-component response regulator
VRQDGETAAAIGAVVSVVLTAALVAAVGMLPPGALSSGLGAAAVAAASLGRRRALLWAIAAVVVAAELVPVWDVAPGGALRWDLNAVVAGLAALVTAAVADLWIVSVEKLRGQRLGLAAREAEIERQNAALQAQGTRLERQGEELRTTNRSLANRELVLAQLLDLSRSLASRLTSSEVMTRICVALASLVARDGGASSVQLRQGDSMRVVCHVGFGDEPPDTESIPFAHSFASVVMARAQTMAADVGDLSEDLRIPQPRTGDRFRSVLSAPLWVEGQVIGAIEAYVRQPGPRSDEDVGLIASMAAQASISLQTARLGERIEDARRRFEAVVRTLPVPVLVARGSDCADVRGNQAAAALLEAAADANFSPFAPAAELVRCVTLREGVPLAPEELPLVCAVSRGEDIAVHELELILAGGHKLAVLASASALHDGAGAVTGGVCTLVDITAQKAMERELETRRREAEEASVRKSRFLAAVSHDIRTPANAIRLQAELIKRTAEDPAHLTTLPRLASELEKSAVSLVDLVRDMLDLTRLDAQHVDLIETEFELDELIAAECGKLSALVAGPGVTVRHVRADQSCWVLTDRVKLGRVIANLLENGVKFTTAGEVRVQMGIAKDGRVRIEVADTGPGIAGENLPHVFDEFFQLQNPERNASKGSGLGLAICRRLVEALGGTIAAESVFGAGATFVVTLPAVVAIPPPQDAHPGTVESRSRLPGLRVVVAEDHELTRAACVQLLRAEGAIVTEARDGFEALQAIEVDNPQVLLLDLMMPRLDGLDVLRRLRDDRPATLERILVVTGGRRVREAPELRELGADAVMLKPIDPARLIHVLRGMTGRSTSVRGNGHRRA